MMFTIFTYVTGLLVGMFIQSRIHKAKAQHG